MPNAPKTSSAEGDDTETGRPWEGPMTTMVIEHPVADFEAWKKAFDSDPLGRARHGIERYVIYRSAEDPRFVVVTLEFASREQAVGYLAPLRQLWNQVAPKLGMGTAPVARVLDEVERAEVARS
jgi:hypothetical protein